MAHFSRKILATALAMCSVGTFCFGQSSDAPPIRVQSNEVVLFVTVLHKNLLGRPMSTKEWDCVRADQERFSKLEPSQPYTPPDCADDVFRGLSAKDFRVFDDGIEQEIQSFTFGFSESGIWDVRDNFGHHYVDFHATGGKWIFSEEPALPVGTLFELLPFYRLSYVAPKSPQGFCHRINVKVDRRDAVVSVGKQYCNYEREPSDPLRDTKFGKTLEKEANSTKTANIPLAAQASVFGNGTAQSRVDVALEFPWKSIKIHWQACGNFYATLGILGLVRNRAGSSLASRFSDAYGLEKTSPPRCADDERPSGSLNRSHGIPTGYETQFYLPSGEYQLQIILSDGSKVGRAEIPITIQSPGQQEPLLSSIALCKRYMDASRAAKEAAALSLTQMYAPLISKGIQFTPTGDTRFRRGEPMIAYFEIYEPALVSDPGTKVQIRLRITNTQTSEIKADTGLRPTDSWVQAGDSTIHIADRIALDQLTTGVYKLEVQASDSAGRSSTWQAASFSVD